MSARMLAAPLLALLCALQLLCLWRTPAVFAPAAINVALAPGQAVMLGRDELAAPQAAAAHLALRRDRAGRWWLRNASAGKQVILRREGVERRMGSSALRAGQWFRIGSARFDVGSASAREIAFTGAGHAWRYDGATLLRDGGAQPACPGAGMALWPRARPLLFGGNLNCGNRLAIANLAGGSAVALRANDALLLSNAAGSEAHAPLLLSSAQGERDLAQREEHLDGVTAIVAGRTRFAVSVDGARLQLQPLRHVALFTEARTHLPAAVTWDWRQRALWTLPESALWWIVAGLCCLRGARSGSALLVLAGVAALLLQRSGASVGVGVSMLLAWGALWTFLLGAGRPALATCAAVLLLGAGLLMQLELGLGAMESSWLRHFQKTAALLAIGLGCAVHLRLRLREPRAIAP
jgi:cell division protein FtsW